MFAGPVIAANLRKALAGESPRAAYRPRRAGKAPAAPTSRIRAGDVEIIESADGDVIRAGDVVLDTRP